LQTILNGTTLFRPNPRRKDYAEGKETRRKRAKSPDSGERWLDDAAEELTGSSSNVRKQEEKAEGTKKTSLYRSQGAGVDRLQLLAQL